MVVDMSRLKGIEVDVGNRTVLVQPGVTTEELRAASMPYGLHFPGGHISSVGISGFILGGSAGWVFFPNAGVRPLLGFTHKLGMRQLAKCYCNRYNFVTSLRV